MCECALALVCILNVSSERIASKRNNTRLNDSYGDRRLCSAYGDAGNWNLGLETSIVQILFHIYAAIDNRKLHLCVSLNYCTV